MIDILFSANPNSITVNDILTTMATVVTGVVAWRQKNKDEQIKARDETITFLKQQIEYLQQQLKGEK